MSMCRLANLLLVSLEKIASDTCSRSVSEAKDLAVPGELVDVGNATGRIVVDEDGKFVLGVVMKDTLFCGFEFEDGVGVSGVDHALGGEEIGPGIEADFFVGRVGKSSLIVGFLVVVVEEGVTSILAVGLTVVVEVGDGFTDG